MDRSIFGRRNWDTNRNRLDRFVAPREAISEARRRQSWHSSWDDHTDNDNQETSFGLKFKKKKYTNHLEKAFDFEPRLRKNPYKHLIRPWPCNPRKKSHLSSADSILDLPSYSYAAFPELIDWNSDNIMVAALGHKYHKWSWDSQNSVGAGFTRYNVRCCKFDPRGDLLLLGTDGFLETIEMHDNSLNKLIAKSVCPWDESHICSITAADWSPTGNSFAVGCSWGSVASFTRDVRKINKRQLGKEAILLVRVSPDARHLAVTEMNSDSVKLLSWPSLDILSINRTGSTIRTITWHPWRSALLGIGSVTADLEPQITLWNVPSCEFEKLNMGTKRQSLDAMLFSRRTGELVLSLWCSDTAILHPKLCSHLIVMSDLETVVDVWGEGRSGLGRVRTMVFSPDGTKLATATSDEDLIIWNFLPEEKNAKKVKRNKQFSTLPVLLDQANYGFSLR